MPSTHTGQVRLDYFFYKGKIDYQAVIQYSRAIGYFLNETERSFYQFIIDCTARFGRKDSYIANQAFTDGQPANEDFAGTMPPPEVSRNTFYKILNTLQRLKLVTVEGNKYTLRFDTLPIEIASDEQVQKGFASRNRHNSALRTAEGIIEWASTLSRKLLAAIQSRSLAEPKTEEKPSETKPAVVSPYSLYYKIQHSPLDKSKGTLAEKMRDIFMGNRTAAQIMQDVATSVSHRKEKVTAKRKARRNLADMTALFESEWARGQREKDKSAPANRIVGRDRALLKTQILQRSHGTDLDTDAFAYWVAHNWQAIGATYFEKAKRYPERPAIPWLIKCFETYIIAWQQRDTLNTEGTRSQTDLMRRAAQTTQMQDAGRAVAEDLERENALLRAQLKERDAIIRKRGNDNDDDNDMLDAETKRIVSRGKKLVLPDYDDEPAPKPRKAKRK